MAITNFDELVEAARREPQPQTMLMLFVRTTLEESHTSEDLERFERGEGGALQPVMSVDRLAANMGNFSSLVAEADQRSTEWDKILIGCLDGQNGSQASGDQVERALDQMIARVKEGASLAGLIAFTREEEPIAFE